MWHLPAFRALLRIFAALTCISIVTACGGGGSSEVVVASPPPVAPLAIALTRVGPNAIQVEWSNDPDVASFTVSRDGFALATVDSLTLIDASVIMNQSYCYQVSGYTPSGLLIAISDGACITVFP
jgi:hypothetical protein